MDEGAFPEYIEMVESPQLRCQNYVNRFHVCMCPHLVFRASIRVSFLLEVCQSPVRVSLLFSCGSCIFQHNADRERAATGWKGLTDATSKDVCVVPKHQTAKWCCWFDGHCLKEKGGLVPFVKRKCLFFFYACVISFSCQGPLGVSANLIAFF